MSYVIWVSASATSSGNGSQTSPYKTIQAALDAAKPGAIIQVLPGTYTENLNIKRSGTAEAPIVLAAAEGPGTVIIKPKSQTSDTVLLNGTDHIEIKGLTIYGPSDADRQAVHIRLRSDSDFASHVLIENNTIHRGGGDGIKGSKAEYVTIRGNTIVGGGPQESAIDFVGVNHSVVESNTILESGHMGITIKGGSDDIRVINNIIDGAGASGMEIGGYTQENSYWPGFLEAGNTYEIRNVVVSGNEISNAKGTALRLIGAQDVEVSGNVLKNSSKLVTIDDSKTFHPTWHSKNIVMSGNSLDSANWLVNRSAGTAIVVGENYDDGRELPSDDGYASTSSLLGTAGDDVLLGNAVANTVHGRDGNDVIDGLAGDDALMGGKGDDLLTGGLGADALTGGEGGDTFLFAALAELGNTAAKRDIVTDFQVGQDKLDLSALDANGSLEGDGAFSLAAAEGGGFSGVAGSLIWDQTTVNGVKVTLVMGDINGDKVADFQIELRGTLSLSSGDFIL